MNFPNNKFTAYSVTNSSVIEAANLNITHNDYSINVNVVIVSTIAAQMLGLKTLCKLCLIQHIYKADK